MLGLCATIVKLPPPAAVGEFHDSAHKILNYPCQEVSGGLLVSDVSFVYLHVLGGWRLRSL